MRPDPHPAPRRVALVLHTFDHGGSGRVAGYLAQGFADRGVEAELVVFARGGEAQGVVERLVRSDLPISYLGRLSGRRPLDLARELPALARWLRARRPDAVVAAANNVALVTAVALRLDGLPDTRLFLKTTNPVALSRHRGLVRALRRWSYLVAFRRATAVWTLSSDETAELRQAFPARAGMFRDVANPYVTPAMLRDAAPAAAPAAGRRVISVARLTAQKRLDRLVAAFALVRTPGARMTILGEGEERASLEAMIERLGLGDRVALPGFSDDVAGALRTADLFVLPSAYEGLPAVVLEAMAANCPVLATDCFPAARSLLAAAAGCAIIDDASPAALAAQIDQHLAQPRPTALRPIAERYSIDAGIDSHLAAMRC